MPDGAIAYFTDWTSGWVGQSHLAAALLALTSGALVLWARKGTRAHVAAGYVYVASLLYVNGSALAKYDLTGSFNLFHAAAFGSLATVFAGFGAALAFRRTRSAAAIAAHGALMIWSYFGLFAALVAEVVTRALPWMLHGEGGWTRFTLAITFFLLATGVLTHKFVQRELRRTLGWPRKAPVRSKGT